MSAHWRFRGSSRSWLVAAAYGGVAVVMTWPLITAIDTEIAGDLGDPVFNSWVLQWTGGQLLQALRGDLGALSAFWSGNIFHPERLALAYSEHLTPQAVQILPVLAATGNAILSYNLLFLSTFVVSGLGMYLLVKDLTGSPGAAFVAGLAFAWAPYRLSHLSHVQVLSTGWMPLALLGYRRFLATLRIRPLIGGAAALLTQVLSCGYYLLFFPPFVAAFCLHEMSRRSQLGSWRVWRALAGSAVIVAVVSWPFVDPYLDARRAGAVGVRPIEEIQEHSADVYALATPASSLVVWRNRLSGWPQPEGQGFPGVVILALASLAVGSGVVRGVRRMRDDAMPTWWRVVTSVLFGGLLGTGLLCLWFMVFRRLQVTLPHLTIVYGPTRIPLARFLWCGVLASALLAAGRSKDRAHVPPVFYWSATLVVAVLLSFGPVIESLGQPVAAGPYAWILQSVPGFDGARSPARMLMLATLCLSVLSGLGAAWILRGRSLLRALLFSCLVVGLLGESRIAPMPVSQPIAVSPGHVAPTTLAVGRELRSSIYQVVQALPDPVVLIELPFGEPALDIRAMYYAGYHRKPIVNGYSGFFPRDYGERVFNLWNPMDAPARASAALTASGATHLLLHRDAYADDTGQALSRWLRSIGARPVAADGPAQLFQLRQGR